MKIQLISPKNVESGRPTDKPKAPIGLEILASVLEARCSGIEIEIFHEEITPGDKILEALDADFVGLSSTFSNHSRCLEIAKVAKRRGSKVIFGGHNATHLAVNILRNHPFVDYVIRGDGEEALFKLVSGYPYKEIENLYYRDGDEIRFTFEQQTDINKLPLFNIEHIVDRKKYDIREPFPESCIRGCIKAAKGNRCAYCSIHTRKIRLLNPDKAWQQIRLLKEKYGLNRFFITGDCFIVGDYPERMLKAKPAGLDVSFRIYERPNAIDESNLDILEKLGVTQVFLGIENVDPITQCKVDKPYDVRRLWHEIKLLEERGIEIIPAFMFGLPGETLESARRNYEYVRTLINNFSNIGKLVVSVTIPLAGSGLFEMLLSNKQLIKDYNECGHDLIHDDIIDYNYLARLMVEYCCHISPEELDEIVQKTRQLLPPEKMASIGNVRLK